MRSVQTFILRLMIDPAEPTLLRGTLQPALGDDASSFVGDKALLSLLHRLTRPLRAGAGTGGVEAQNGKEEAP